MAHYGIEAHEILHGVIDWHQDFAFGDNQLTLNPACDAMIEAEANYGGGRLLFLGERFIADARDGQLDFPNIKKLAGVYGNSIQSTMWRMIEERTPDHPVFGMVSVHPRHPSVGAKDYAGQPRLIRSARFREQFANVAVEDVYRMVEKHAKWNKRGPVLETEDTLTDGGGRSFEFNIESFSTGHALLTFGVCARLRPVSVAAR